MYRPRKPVQFHFLYYCDRNLGEEYRIEKVWNLKQLKDEVLVKIEVKNEVKTTFFLFYEVYSMLKLFTCLTEMIYFFLCKKFS